METMIPMTKQEYIKLVNEDLEWLYGQPQTLERDHIETMLKGSVHLYYPNRGWVDMREMEPPMFGDYLVMVEPNHQITIKCWHGHPEDVFDDGISTEWALNEDEIVTHWMPLPDYPLNK